MLGDVIELAAVMSTAALTDLILRLPRVSFVLAVSVSCTALLPKRSTT